ncbi:MAG TPA: FAD-binding protein [Polyangiaceae bacterium]|jgi:alkyldihydroxyacetonephosphate synthase
MADSAPFLHDLSRALPALRTSADAADRVAYARDLWPRHHLAVREGRAAEYRPGAIAWPTSTEEVAHLVRWARRVGVALVPFGAGSGVCAGVLPRDDVLVVDLKRMGRVRALDAGAPRVDVEAGHMGVPLEQTLERAGFTLGHFPSSILCSTVGGWVAARSAGQCSGAYGKIEDMVAALECVTGDGEVVTLRRRTTGPDLVPLLVGSEGTLGIITSATLRLHPAPTTRSFGAWSFPTTQRGWEAIRAMFQAGLRPAVSRLYDPFDAMLAKQGGVKTPRTRRVGEEKRERSPGFGGAALRAVLRRPAALNDLLHWRATARALGGAMLVVIFEGTDERAQGAFDGAREIAESMQGRWEGEAPARRWLAHRYSVSYRQAPVFASGAFVDTMEVAATWSRLGDLYEGVRRALGEHVFVMAHFSHAYPDGCCIYFSFAGSADPGLVRQLGWDAACAATYDRAWRAALAAAVEAGGTLAHHHGVGRSKAPRLPAELGTGVDVVHGLMRAFDPAGILNPGNLLTPRATTVSTATSTATSSPTASPPLTLDRESLLACVEGATDLATAERLLNDVGLTLDARLPTSAPTLATWLAQGAPGARDRWLDPVDQLLAGLDATMTDGRVLSIRPAPRRAVGPDLTALFVGTHGRFGRIDRAWMRVHPVGVPRHTAPAFRQELDPAPNAGEKALLEAIARAL